MIGSPAMTPSLTLGPCPALIVGSGAAFPADPIDNASLLTRLAPGLPTARRDALLAHLDGELGVTSRAHLQPGSDPLILATRAARQALAEASTYEPRAILLATSTASRWTTAESARLANALGLAVAFCDLKSGCTGGLWALIEAARLARDSAAPVLVVGCDSFSRAFPAGERLLPFAMGDGAAALVVAPGGDAGLLRAAIGGEPRHVDLATVAARLPPATPSEPFALSGDPEPFARAAESALGAAINALPDRPADTLLVPHVSRLATARRLAAATGLACFTAGFTAHGNLGAASLLVALHLIRAQRLRSPSPLAQHVLLASAGGGLSYGAALWRFAPTLEATSR